LFTFYCQTGTLTTNVDTTAIAGGAGDDTYIAAHTTISALDVINGGAGTDTLTVTSDNTTTPFILPASIITSIETMTIRGSDAVTANVSGTNVTGLESIAVTQATAATLTAAATTDVNVSGVAGAVGVNGGKNISVTDAGTTTTIGDATGAAGTVTVTDSAQGASAIAINGGTDVTVNSTGSTVGAAINIGQAPLAASPIPTGVVTVTSTNAAAATADLALSTITVDGGSTITATQTAAAAAAATSTGGFTVTQGAVTLQAGTATTAITSTQSASTAETLAKVAVTAVAATSTVTFKAMTATQTTTIDGLTFTASKALTAEQVAQAFANLGSLDTQANGGVVANGYYTGALTTTWTSGAATGATVAFTAPTSILKPAVSGSVAAAGDATTATAATAAVTAVTGVLGVINGKVVIDDNTGTASVTTVTVDGYGATSTIGATRSMDALTTLSLANSGGAAAGNKDADMTVTTTATTLGLTLNNVNGVVDLAHPTALKTLNITTTGADSATALDAVAVTTLNVSGTKAVNLATATLTALTTVTVSGSAGLTIDATEADTLTSVTSTSTGTVSAHIRGTAATYTGGAGVDNVTMDTDTTITKAINLGAGDDSLTLVALTTAATGGVNGGDGTDTLSMTIATAEGLDGTVTFSTQVTNFERLTINDIVDDVDDIVNVTDTTTLNMANLGFNYVTTSGTDVAGTDNSTLVLDKMSTNGTVVLTAQGLITAQLTDTSGTDTFNVALSKAGALAAGTFTAAGIETINIDSTDTTANYVAASSASSLTLVATSATTLNVTGNSDFTLVTTGNTAVTSVNASTMTGALTLIANGAAAGTTVTGGAGNDKLTASGSEDTLIGGAGNDILTGTKLTSMTGGAGNDTFKASTGSIATEFSYITDFAAGDVIDLTDGNTFISTKFTQVGATLSDYVNAAITNTAANSTSWFNLTVEGTAYTFIVDNQSAAGTGFDSTQDMVIAIVGTVDLSTASYNQTNGTIEIA